jgi:hypothetical protein
VWLPAWSGGTGSDTSMRTVPSVRWSTRSSRSARAGWSAAELARNVSRAAVLYGAASSLWPPRDEVVVPDRREPLGATSGVDP